MDQFDIRNILEEGNLLIHFHPIVSIPKKSIIGIEALCRGFDKVSKQLIPPLILFHLAEEQGVMVELECFIRKMAIDLFYNEYSKDSKKVLFLNVSPYFINHKVYEKTNIFESVAQLEINPNQIVIEIQESEIKDFNILKSFVKNCRDAGFLIALENLGTGHSSIERIMTLKPDIMKLDRYLIQNIEDESYKQKFFKSIVKISKKIGALVVAQGVETVEECLMAHEMGADMLQGFYFSKPDKMQKDLFYHSESQILLIGSYLKLYKKEKINFLKSKSLIHEDLVEKILAQLLKRKEDDFDQELSKIIKHYPFVECVFVLDKNGHQITDTICNLDNTSDRRKLIFHPAPKGQDHSLKEYFLIIESGLKEHITEPYISLASGNLCITLSIEFVSSQDNHLILCIDITT